MKGFWEFYNRIYGKLAGWKNAKFFYEEEGKLVNKSQESLKLRRELVGSKTPFESLVREEFDALMKIRHTPILYHEIKKLPDTSLVSENLKINLRDQLVGLGIDNIDWKKISTLLTKEEKILKKYQSKLLKK